MNDYLSNLDLSFLVLTNSALSALSAFSAGEFLPPNPLILKIED